MWPRVLTLRSLSLSAVGLSHTHMHLLGSWSLPREGCLLSSWHSDFISHLRQALCFLEILWYSRNSVALAWTNKNSKYIETSKCWWIRSLVLFFQCVCVGTICWSTHTCVLRTHRTFFFFNPCMHETFYRNLLRMHQNIFSSIYLYLIIISSIYFVRVSLQWNELDIRLWLSCG